MIAFDAELRAQGAGLFDGALNPPLLSHISTCLRQTASDMLDTEWAYLAGLIDGEGTISLYVVRSHAHRYEHVLPRLQVCNTDLRMMDWLRNIDVPFRFTSTLSPNGKGGPRRKRLYVAAITRTADLRVVLPHLIPHLTVKRERAEVVLQYLETVDRRWANAEKHALRVALLERWRGA